MTLLPSETTTSSNSLELRDHSPCGAKLQVSSPNQFTPVSRTSWPAASRMRLPEVRKPGPDARAGSVPPMGIRAGIGPKLALNTSKTPTTTGSRQAVHALYLPIATSLATPLCLGVGQRLPSALSQPRVPFVRLVRHHMGPTGDCQQYLLPSAAP